MDLQSLLTYADVSERTLREWIHDPIDPLPASRIKAKLFIRRSAFDEYMDRHKLAPASLVDDLIKGLDVQGG
jgi:hypothetical protein